MTAQEIKGDDYQVRYEPASATVHFNGKISLARASDYAPIVNLLNEVAALEKTTITLNLKELEFLNSSGISMLSKFVLGMRKKQGTQLIVLGSKKMPWQAKSLKNLERLLPGLKLVVE